MALHRPRRISVSRPDHAQIQQIQKLRTWPETSPASTWANGDPRPKRDRAPGRLLVAAAVALFLVLGAIIGLAGSGALYEALRTLGFGGETAIETAQREQAAAISQLDIMVRALNAAVAGLSAHADFAGEQEKAASRRMALIDNDVGALRASINEMRVAQSAAAAEEPWRRPMAQLVSAVTKTRSEMVELRASLDEVSNARHPDWIAIGERIDRLEQAMLQHNLLGPLRGSVHDAGVRQRPVVSRDGSSADAADGHVIDLAPAAD